ncbi:DUF6998 domain-containing protein [Bacteroidota bacterium]
MKIKTLNIGPVIKQLYDARNQLRKRFPEFSFTLYGKLVGDIGEAIAIHEFGFEKLKSGTKRHDCVTSDNKKVQIKTTQQSKSSATVGLGNKKQKFQYLIVLQISEDGKYNILYDGPGKYINKAWKYKKSPQLSISQLKCLNDQVKKSERLVKV